MLKIKKRQSRKVLKVNNNRNKNVVGLIYYTDF